MTTTAINNCAELPCATTHMEHPLDEVYRQKFADAKANGTKNPALKEAEVAAATSAAAAAAAQDAFADQLAADQLADPIEPHPFLS